TASSRSARASPTGTAWPSLSTFRAASSAGTGPRRSSTSSTRRSAASSRSCMTRNYYEHMFVSTRVPLVPELVPEDFEVPDGLRQHLDDVRAHELDPCGDLADGPEQVERRHPAGLRGARPRRERRIEHVDVDRQVDRALADVRKRPFDDLPDAEVVDVVHEE